jgi:hypothetical protein
MKAIENNPASSCTQVVQDLGHSPSFTIATYQTNVPNFKKKAGTLW